jgi:glycosyltransferase involved in cell wall biosynthesis
VNSKENPLVTVYITNYNYGQYLEEAILSVLDQNFQDFELLIIDDGSTDNSMEIIKRFEKLQHVFAILQQNRGLTVSNNVALKMARGKYFMRLDADDFLDPHCLEVMVSTMEKEITLTLIFPDYYEVDESGEIINQVRRHDFKKEVTLLDQPAHGACSMIRTKALIEVGGYDESFDRQDGYDLWLKLIDSYQVRNINLPLFYYRKHTNSLSSDDKMLLETRAKIIKKRFKNKQKRAVSVLVVIPTRGNKMDPRSMPLRKLRGKILIDWTIEAALDSEFVTNTLVTTPDNDVIQHIKDKYDDKIIPIMRSKELARINSKYNETILESIRKYEEEHSSPDMIMTLNIEAPFKTSMYIDKAIHTLQIYDVDVVQSVIVDDGTFFEHDGTGLKPRLKNSLLRLERNNLFKQAGGIRIYQKSAVVKDKFSVGKIGHLMVDNRAAFELKSEFDWELVNNFI